MTMILVSMWSPDITELCKQRSDKYTTSHKYATQSEEAHFAEAWVSLALPRLKAWFPQIWWVPVVSSNHWCTVQIDVPSLQFSIATPLFNTVIAAVKLSSSSDDHNLVLILFRLENPRSTHTVCTGTASTLCTNADKVG